MEKIKKMFSSKSSRNGTYSVGLAVIVIAIAIVINLVAGQLPEKVRNIDISSNNRNRLQQSVRYQQRVHKNAEEAG